MAGSDTKITAASLIFPEAFAIPRASRAASAFASPGKTKTSRASGFGFGKTLENNFELLKGLHRFNELDVPVLAGLSRKSMVNKVLDIGPEDALNGTTALNMIALMQGASILRVHDVKEAVQCVKLFQAYSQAGT